MAEELARLRLQLYGRASLAARGLDHAVTQRLTGDATLVLVEDLGGVAHRPVSSDELATWQLSADAALALGRKNAVRATHDIQVESVALPGARCEIAVANSFYMAAAMLEALPRISDESPLIACALTWHHWLACSLDASADRETLRHLGGLVERLDAAIMIADSARVGRALWWWPAGSEQPEPFEVEGPLPAELAELVDRPPVTS